MHGSGWLSLNPIAKKQSGNNCTLSIPTRALEFVTDLYHADLCHGDRNTRYKRKGYSFPGDDRGSEKSPNVC